jgi:hypothetical protein
VLTVKHLRCHADQHAGAADGRCSSSMGCASFARTGANLYMAISKAIRSP